MTKKELRKLYREKRLMLSPQEIVKLDDLLLIQFQRLDFGLDVNILFSYFAIKGWGEIDPFLFSNYMRLTLPYLQVAYPVVNVNDCTMQASIINDDTIIGINTFNIEEPENGTFITSDQVDVIFVPLLAFDKEGYRVGYGKGFYDRFISTCSDKCITVGFSYFEAIDKIADTHQFDIPLNYCITPRHLYEF